MSYEFDLLVKTMALVDTVLAEPPLPHFIEASEEDALEADRQYDEAQLRRMEETHT